MTAKKRYAVLALAKNSPVWEGIYYTGDLSKAKRHAAAMLESKRVEAIKVVDLTTGEVVKDDAPEKRA